MWKKEWLNHTQKTIKIESLIIRTEACIGIIYISYGIAAFSSCSGALLPLTTRSARQIRTRALVFYLFYLNKILFTMIYEFYFLLLRVTPSAKLIVMAPTTKIRIMPKLFIYFWKKNCKRNSYILIWEMCTYFKTWFTVIL